MPAVVDLPSQSASSVEPSPNSSTTTDGPNDTASTISPSTLPPAFSPDSVEWEEWRGDWPFLHHALAGSFAGVMEHLTMYPIDTIKTRMQAFRGPGKVSQRTCQPPSGASRDSGRACTGGIGESSGGSARSRNGTKADMRSVMSFRSSPWSFNPVAEVPQGDRGIRMAQQTPRTLYTAGAAVSPLRWLTRAPANRFALAAPTRGPRGAHSLGAFAAAGNMRVWGQKIQGKRELPSSVSPIARRSLVRTALHGNGVMAPAVSGWIRSTATGSIRSTTTRSTTGGDVVASGVSGSSKGLMGGNGLVAGLRSVYVEGGSRGLYRGAGVVVAGCVPAHACYFTSYEFVKERMWARARKRHEQQHHHHEQPRAADTAAETATPAEAPAAYKAKWASEGRLGQHTSATEGDADSAAQRLTHWELLACGMCATLSHDFILTPVDVVKQRMQLGCFRSLTDCVTATLQREGPLAFIRSLPVSVLLNLPHGATLVYTNETLKTHLTPNQPSATPSLSTYFFCAGVSGGVAGFISNPLDVVKTRLQTQDCAIRESRAALAGVAKAGSCPLGPCPPKYQSLLGTVRTIWLEEGLQGFWRGVNSRVCLSIPATAICWGSYETFKFLWHASTAGS